MYCYRGGTFLNQNGNSKSRNPTFYYIGTEDPSGNSSRLRVKAYRYRLPAQGVFGL